MSTTAYENYVACRVQYDHARAMVGTSKALGWLPSHRETAQLSNARQDLTRALIRLQRHARRSARRHRKAVIARGGGRCASCATTSDLCTDHVIPITLGGSLDESNMQLLCRSCNSRKGNRAA